MAKEITNPYGLNDTQARDPTMQAAWLEASELQDKHVVDVNGLDLGRVSACFVEGGALTRCDVSLHENAKHLLDVERDVASIPPIAIGRVEGDTIHLQQAGEQLLRPEDPRPVGASDDLRGAQELSRKER